MFVEQGKNKNQYLGNNEILRVMFDEKKVIKMNEMKVTFNPRYNEFRTEQRYQPEGI